VIVRLEWYFNLLLPLLAGVHGTAGAGSIEEARSRETSTDVIYFEHADAFVVTPAAISDGTVPW
jgi:hypothetical protein